MRITCTPKTGDAKTMSLSLPYTYICRLNLFRHTNVLGAILRKKSHRYLLHFIFTQLVLTQSNFIHDVFFFVSMLLLSSILLFCFSLSCSPIIYNTLEKMSTKRKIFPFNGFFLCYTF